MNIIKRLFNWVQSGPVDFCYVTGEWGFKSQESSAPAISNDIVLIANNRRAPAKLRAPIAAFDASRVSAPVAARAFLRDKR